MIFLFSYSLLIDFASAFSPSPLLILLRAILMFRWCFLDFRLLILRAFIFPDISFSFSLLRDDITLFFFPPLSSPYAWVSSFSQLYASLWCFFWFQLYFCYCFPQSFLRSFLFFRHALCCFLLLPGCLHFSSFFDIFHTFSFPSFTLLLSYSFHIAFIPYFSRHFLLRLFLSISDYVFLHVIYLWYFSYTLYCRAYLYRSSDFPLLFLLSHSLFSFSISMFSFTILMASPMIFFEFSRRLVHVSPSRYWYCCFDRFRVFARYWYCFWLLAMFSDYFQDIFMALKILSSSYAAIFSAAFAGSSSFSFGFAFSFLCFDAFSFFISSLYFSLISLISLFIALRFLRCFFSLIYYFFPPICCWVSLLAEILYFDYAFYFSRVFTPSHIRPFSLLPLRCFLADFILFTLISLFRCSSPSLWLFLPCFSYFSLRCFFGFILISLFEMIQIIFIASLRFRWYFFVPFIFRRFLRRQRFSTLMPSHAFFIVSFWIWYYFFAAADFICFLL